MKKSIELSDKSIQYLCDCAHKYKREILKPNGRRPRQSLPVTVVNKYIKEVIKETERLGFKESEEIS